jgi:hypothetical protein
MATANAADAPASPEYRTQFRVDIRPGEAVAQAGIRVVQPDARLKRLRLLMPRDRFSSLTADGRITRRGDEVTWEIPPRGGEIRYQVTINRQRSDKGYDALVTARWAMFRADHVFPRARAVHKRATRGRGELVLVLPAGWTSFTPYLPDPTGRVTFLNPKRSFSRPVGWVLAGHLGSRMDMIGPTMVRIAAPRNQNVQRVAMLSLMRAVMPVLQAELATAPPYLLVVSAGDPMWRGGLSAPNSFYLHADRPIIGENGTSTLVHELVHLLAPVPADADHDWIDEGVAEYLGLLLLRRAGAISPERFDHAIEIFRRQGATVSNIVTPSSSGAVNARAVVIFHDLDVELQRRSGGKSDMFDLVRLLMSQQQPVDISRLRDLAMDLAGGQPLQALSPAKLPGSH